MRKYIPTVLLWLFVINLGVAFGAGIYESRVVVPIWEWLAALKAFSLPGKHDG